MTPEELFEKIEKGKEGLTPEEITETEAAATAFLIETRDQFSTDDHMRHLVNFHFAAVALHDAFAREGMVLSASLLGDFMPDLIKVCHVEFTHLHRREE